MRLVVVFALLALLAVAVPASRASSGQQPGVTRHVLDNGLVVIIKENPSSDLVVTEALVRAGPRLEDPATSGTTFFLRGMLVRGTERRTGAEIAQTIESLGGQLGGGPERISRPCTPSRRTGTWTWPWKCWPTC